MPQPVHLSDPCCKCRRFLIEYFSENTDDECWLIVGLICLGENLAISCQVDVAVAFLFSYFYHC